MSLRLKLYRGMARLLRNFGESKRFHCAVSLGRIEDAIAGEVVVAAGGECGWFHASSFGELEILWPAIKEWAAGARDRELILTIFSVSAEPALKRLVDELASGGHRVRFAGFCPWEGDWEAAVGRFRPRFFATAKYEAWPELWVALQRCAVPLVIVGALERKSLRAATVICALLGEKLPRMLLLPSRAEAVPPLATLFPAAVIRPSGEPRWDRVQQRSINGNRRASELISMAEKWPRPWCVLGSVWEEDLRIWKDALKQTPGTLWIVPHLVDPASIEKLGGLLEEAGMAPKISSKSTSSLARNLNSGRPCWLIDEMGFLLELYKSADSAYVGGGFGEGVHSTIEPALHGIPVAIGPKGAARFPEIAELQETGQLTVVRSPGDVARWVENTIRLDESKAVEWRAQAGMRLGATVRVLREIQDFVTQPNGVLI